MFINFAISSAKAIVDSQDTGEETQVDTWDAEGICRVEDATYPHRQEAARLQEEVLGARWLDSSCSRADPAPQP